MPPTPTIAIGYVRVSTEEQATEGVSLKAQREKIAAYAALHGLALGKVFADEGLSAKRADNRPGLQDALTAVCKAKGVLVVYSLTRLARSTRDAIDIAERIDGCGADLASITEKIDTTSSMGRFFFRLMASLGELERDQVSERTITAMAHLRGEGKRISRIIPFGFDLGADGETLEENREETKALRRMVEWQAQGVSLRGIAARLEAKGVRPKQGGHWYASSVRAVLWSTERRGGV